MREIMTLNEVHRLVSNAGPGAANVTPPDVIEYYTEQIHMKSRDDLEVWPDVSYGPDPRHDLDIYAPKDRPTTALPVVMFFFGGGFTEGSKNGDGQWISGNVAAHFARHEMIGITANYRLAPDFQTWRGRLTGQETTLASTAETRIVSRSWGIPQERATSPLTR
jgi:acetyl esterase/lipase